MDNIIISDISCLIALSKIDKLDLLKDLYHEIIITNDVYQEFGGLLPDWIIITEVKDKQKQRIEETLNTKFFIYPIDFKGMQRVEKDECPVAAVREMVLNALVHRNYMGSQTQIRLYNDNFGIWNDGGLPDELTEDDLKRTHRSKPRNPIIADVCFKAGYIDTWGRGTLKIIEACKEHNLPEPILKGTSTNKNMQRNE